MKNTPFIVFVLLLVTQATSIFAQKNVYQSDAVIATADQLKFRYKEVLKKAANQDSKAIMQFFEFSRVVDGQEAIEHALTCMELIPVAGDRAMAKAIELLKPGLKKVVLERILKAQGKTDKEALKEPIKSWAPYTWEALNNRPVIFPSTRTTGGPTGGTLKDTDQPAPPPSGGSLKPTDSERGRGN